MTDFNFKEGDKVYYPAATNEVILRRYRSSEEMREC